MKRHKFTRWNKERISVYTSAALVVGVCVISGLYVTHEAPSKTQIIDMESVGENNLSKDGSAANDDRIEQQNDVKNKSDNAKKDNEVIATTNSSDSKMPVANTYAEEYAKRMEEERKRREEEKLNAVVDLTGDFEVEDEELPVSAPTASKAKTEELHFSATDRMTWPVMGNVILNYSMDARIYLPTLNQYSYYPAIAISANVGDPVSAAAKGVVSKIGYNEEIGQYMDIDMGDGYKMTYGQLKDISLKEGDCVSRGQIIGNVCEPTKYYTMEGANLYVKMEQNGQSMDPVAYFE